MDDKWDFSPEGMRENFVLVFGTTTVFDRWRRKLIDITALRLAARKPTNRWLKDKQRRIIDQEDVVFDPTGKSNPRTTVNLFRGFSMKPVPGACELQLELLRHLCGGSAEAFLWVLRWLAYPLQHPGAKMQTALVIHGPEGVGKNVFFNAIRRIYGEYGGSISQSEIECQFNGWATAKLFIILNEVLTRSEIYHTKGRLKNMITEPEWMINEKHLPVRPEANHCNFVFFANAVQPVGLDPDDRRYAVLWTPPPKTPDFYPRVAEEQENGGIAALYDYLLRLDLGDFNENTKPLFSQAKQDLIELGMENHERFFRQWKTGELALPFAPCRTLDLYEVYGQWCRERGERAVAREAVFSAAIGKRVRKTRKWYSLPGIDGSKKQAHFFVPEDFVLAAGVPEHVQLGRVVASWEARQTARAGDSGDGL